VAAQGISLVVSIHLSPTFDHVAGMLRRYREELEAHKADSGRLNGHVAHPNYGFAVHVHVAETDALARAQAKPAFDQFMHNFTYRYVRKGEPNRWADRMDFADELERGRLIAGSPATVREQLGAYIEQSGANYVLGVFAFGSLPADQVLSSVNLFAREVMPALSRRVPAAAKGG
jgi:alkanesulfonate monooxygenase SsuD/methylene tetrahydromethanopterin reductase-like flavin-dependent oxidoreductase (luciferase family)